MMSLNKIAASIAVYAMLVMSSAFAAVGNDAAVMINDADINQMVESKIMSNVITKDSDIKAETREGIVYLSGNVKTNGEADSAVESASSVAGVKDVDTENLMIPDSSQPYADSYITAKVKGAFMREKLFGDSPIASLSISVETKEGVVYLTGMADNQDQIDTAMVLARGIKGVKQVEANVTMNKKVN